MARLRFTWRHDESGETGDLATFTPAFGDWWRAHATSHVGFLAEVDRKPIGMAWLGIFERIPGPERFRRRSGMIQSVYVLPSMRGQGIGSTLINQAIQSAQDHGLAYLMVHPSARSYSVYERAGFGPTRSVLELGLTEPRLQG
jgi:GNAT superfamily N-acetyltransferase